MLCVLSVITIQTEENVSNKKMKNCSIKEIDTQSYTEEKVLDYSEGLEL